VFGPWKPLTRFQLIFALVALGLIAWMRLFSAQGWVRFLDDANLVFHEAGHPVFGLIGPIPGLYGGTAGQLFFPAILTADLWRKREPLGFALCFGWLFENFLNIGRYMADARTQALPLVGGGEHDWTAIFARWGVLRYDRAIGGGVIALGWLGIAGCAIWLIFRYRAAKS
jgi:hypothetical protein